MALISQTEIEQRLGRPLTADEVDSFNTINQAMQFEVERMIGSDIEPVQPATRYYDGGVQHLAIDPCTDITAIKYVDDDENVVETLDTTDYTLEPRKYTMKTMVRHRNKFYTGINNVAITAKFSINGDAKVLEIVRNALINALVAEIQNIGNIKRENIEGYSVEYIIPESKSALNSIKYLFPEV